MASVHTAKAGYVEMKVEEIQDPTSSEIHERYDHHVNHELLGLQRFVGSSEFQPLRPNAMLRVQVHEDEVML